MKGTKTALGLKRTLAMASQTVASLANGLDIEWLSVVAMLIASRWSATIHAEQAAGFGQIATPDSLGDLGYGAILPH